MRPLTVGSLFSGVGGFEMGFERAGFVTRWQCEIDPDATSVLERHWPNVRRYRDVTEVDPADLEPVDVITFGSPCQGFSVAGTRGGLDDHRSGLFGEAIRIIRGLRPAVAVWENVPGAFSTDDGRDFGAVLAALAESGALDIAWRVLDAQWFGVPQRRRRIFLVADFGGERAAQVLFESEGVRGDSQAGREAWEGTAGAAEDGAGVGGVVCSESGPGWWNEGFGCLRAEGENRPSRPSHVVLEPAVIGTITANYGNQNGQDAYGCLVAEPVAAEGGNRTSGPLDVAACLSTSTQRLDFETQTLIVSSETAATFTAGSHDSHAPGRRREDDVNLVALSFEQRIARNGRGVPSEVVNALKAEAGRTGKGDAAPCVAESDGLRWIVRRLTPLEGERCQGWPDDWSRWRADGSEISDSARWRMIGNGVATPVAYWIATRLRAALAAGQGQEQGGAG